MLKLGADKTEEFYGHGENLISRNRIVLKVNSFSFRIHDLPGRPSGKPNNDRKGSIGVVMVRRSGREVSG